MSIHLHIERLVLDSVLLADGQAAQIGAALEQELARLLRAQGLATELSGGAALARANGGTLDLGRLRTPAQLGRSIAHAVHAGIQGAGHLPTQDAAQRKPDGGRP